MVSRIALLILLIFDLDGFIKRHGILFGNSYLWSLIVIYASASSITFTRSTIDQFYPIFLAAFSSNVKTNKGKIFLRLLKRHFPKENPLHKIFYKNKLKVSYSSMGNVASVLSAHNRSILYPKKSDFCCNCRSKTDCPLDNKCLTPKIVY